jgi:hypothetical protein
MAANAVRRYVCFNTIRNSRLRDRGQETILYSFKGGDGGSVPSSALIDVGVLCTERRASVVLTVMARSSQLLCVGSIPVGAGRIFIILVDFSRAYARNLTAV